MEMSHDPETKRVLSDNQASELTRTVFLVNNPTHVFYLINGCHSSAALSFEADIKYWSSIEQAMQVHASV